MDKITDCWKNFSITEEDDEIAGIDGVEIKDRRRVLRCGLWGKLLSVKPYNKLFFQSTMINVSRVKGVVSREVAKDMFLFSFADERDRKKVLDVGPWSFDRTLVALKWVEDEDMIPLHNLPLDGCIAEVGETIGDIVGQTIDVQTDENVAMMSDLSILPYGSWLRAPKVGRGGLRRPDRKENWTSSRHGKDNWCETMHRQRLGSLNRREAISSYLDHGNYVYLVKIKLSCVRVLPMNGPFTLSYVEFFIQSHSYTNVKAAETLPVAGA
ncbi:hypothetical protein L484_000869 [Morus notabilis]|uniref:DUF4283 domain-containing protein n=1 Tax=Morus notabilis TaxID=981085 RepID=W9SE27_9ROSA|nr:hypothetical protein L484_000869 [Morus notabilis]